MSHCPWTYRAVSIAGNAILPCCRYQGGFIIEKDLNYEYAHGELNDIRTRLDNGEKLKQCYECWLDEELGKKSMRMHGIDRWGHVTEPEIRYAEFELDNVCNLKCVSCSSNNSTAWIKDEQKMLGETVAQGYRPSTDLYKQIDISKLETVKLFGGEPLMSKNILSLCKDLTSSPSLENLEISINTNVTVRPNKDVEKVFLECKHLHINLSLDGIEDLNSFVRKNSDWETVLDNLEYYNSLLEKRSGKSTYIGVHSVVHVYNINYIHEIQTYYRENFPNFSLSLDPLIRPRHISIINLPKDYKDMIRPYLQQHGYDQILQYLDQDGENLFDYFVDYHTKLMELWKVDLSKINPQLDNYIKNYKAKPIDTKRIILIKKGHDA